MMLLLAAVLSQALGAGLSLDAPGDAAAREILFQPEYAFCNDGAYPLTEAEARWCPLVDTHGAAHCPGLATACQGPRATLAGSGRLSSRTVEDADAGAVDDAQAESPADQDPEVTRDAGGERLSGEGPRRERKDSAEALELPVLGGVAQILFWAIIVLAAVLVVAAVFRNVVRDDRPEPDDAADEPDDATDEADDDARAAAIVAMETDVDRLLALAGQAARDGAYGEAVDFAHAALLRRLDHEGLIRLHASRTNGEYIRELGSNTALHQPVRDALRRVDRAQFGPEPPGRTVYEDIRGRVTSIVKTVGPMALLLAALLGAGLACDSATQPRYPWSTSPSGTDAVFELLERQGLAASYRSAPLTDLDADEARTDPLIVMLGGAAATDAEWQALQAWVREGGQLVLAGSELPRWVRVTYVHDPEPDLDALEYEAPFALTPSEDAVVVRAGDWSGPGASGNDYITAFDLGFGGVTVLADDHLFTNAALAFPGNPEALVQTVGSFERSEVEFVDAWASVGARNPAESIAHTHLTAAIVQLLVLVVALYLWRGVRFGRGRDPAGQSRRAFVQHAVAMGRQYEKAKAATFAAGLFSAWVLERLRNRFSSAASAGLLGLAQEVARVSGRDETDVMRLLVTAHGAIESRLSPGGTGEDLALIRDLGRLMRDIGETT
ncbi:MAG: DUF4350 domain-containing protein [Nannocystaceae bacterium]|nr:DUF4350 domain-containing protein [bacterium]